MNEALYFAQPVFDTALNANGIRNEALRKKERRRRKKKETNVTVEIHNQRTETSIIITCSLQRSQVFPVVAFHTTDH